jgi:hypothetical protein
MKAVDISQQVNIVSFRGGFFPFRFLSNLRVLGPVSRGEIEVLPGTPAVVKYRLSTVGMLVDVLVIALAMMIFIGITRSILMASLAFPLMFGVFFGTNYLIAVFRLTSFVISQPLYVARGHSLAPTVVLFTIPPTIATMHPRNGALRVGKY